MNRPTATPLRQAIVGLALAACTLVGAEAADRTAPRQGSEAVQPADGCGSLAALPFVDDPTDEDLLLLDGLVAEEPATESSSGATLAATLPLLLLLVCVGTFWRLERQEH